MSAAYGAPVPMQAVNRAGRGRASDLIPLCSCGAPEHPAWAWLAGSGLAGDDLVLQKAGAVDRGLAVVGFHVVPVRTGRNRLPVHAARSPRLRSASTKSTVPGGTASTRCLNRAHHTPSG